MQKFYLLDSGFLVPRQIFLPVSKGPSIKYDKGYHRLCYAIITMTLNSYLRDQVFAATALGKIIKGP
jgi:hypothetical protein